jgi:citrate lyase beta subunit
MRHPAATSPLLYVPGDRATLAEDLRRSHCPKPYSIAICLEDAVRGEDRSRARLIVADALSRAGEIPARVLLRPDSADSLRKVIDVVPMERVAGFVLPKASAASLEQWLSIAGDRLVMPILETGAVLEHAARAAIADLCADHRARVPCARIGANDLFAVLGGLRRPKGRTVYETPLAGVIDDLIATFGPRGVPLCGPVMDWFSDTGTLVREVKEDVHRGLFGKSAIHPCQLAVIWDAMLPTEDELEQARAVVSPSAPAVFAMHGTMLEPACHRPWAERLLELERMAATACMPAGQPGPASGTCGERR